MAATVTAPPALSPSGTGGPDHEDSNISSPLSEVDDKDTNDDDINMHLEDEGDDNGSSPGAEEHPNSNHDGSDSDSVLSDARSMANTEANDTEAETERLYDTPQHQRRRDVVVDQFNDGQIFEHTPSKLRRGTAAQDDDEAIDDESLSGDAASITSSRTDDGEDIASKPTTTKDTSVEDEAQQESLDRKRKRSMVAEQSDTEEPLRKRTGSVAAEADADLDTAADEDEPASGGASSSHRSPVAELSPNKQDAVAEEVLSERETRAQKARNGAKRQDKTADNSSEETNASPPDEAHDSAAPDEAQNPEENIDDDAENEAGIAARNAEELEKKHAAFRDWSHIEERFGIFRDRLYKDRLQRLEEEEQSLLADEPTHPEYLNMKRCLDDRLDRKLREFAKEQEFSVKALERRAVAERAQIWSQYFQAIREKREAALSTLNSAWYDVQTARRDAHSLQDCGLLFPKDPQQRVRNAVAYNTEVSTLAGIAKYEGFPAGPEMRGASAVELAHDLNAIEQARRGRPIQAVHQREEYQTPVFSRLGPAGEQFLKDTPWANPNHSLHKSPNSPSQAGGKPEQPSASSLGSQPTTNVLSGETKSVAETPVSTQRTALPGRLDSPDIGRSMLKSAPMKRAGNMSSLGRSSKAAAA